MGRGRGVGVRMRRPSQPSSGGGQDAFTGSSQCADTPLLQRTTHFKSNIHILSVFILQFPMQY